MRHRLLAFLAVGLLTTAASAQTSTAANLFTPANSKPAASTGAAKSGRAPIVRTAKSLNCSKQADAKGLHGQPRKHFMSSCKKA